MNDSPPPVFYKYNPIEDWLPAQLSGKSMLFSARSTFNDPFDSRPGFRIAHETKEGMKFILDGIKEMRTMSPAKRILEARRYANTQKKAQHGENRFLEDFLDSIGILSLASCWKNELMWSHYAKDHNGICVGFKSDVDFFATAMKVKYDFDLPIINHKKDDNDTLLQKTFFTKSECWKYEDEWRVIKQKLTQYEKDTTYEENENFRRLLIDSNGPNAYEFNKSAIESVTIGMRTDKKNEEYVIQSMVSAANKVPLYKATSARLKYSIERKLIGTY